MKFLPWIILVTLIFLLLVGCSYETNAGDNKAFKFRYEDAGTNLKVTKGLMNNASYKVAQDSFNDYFDDNALSMPTTIDLDYLIDKGYLAIIPKNPYTGKDVKQSEDYSPGDACFKFNFFEGGEYKVHYGKGSLSYKPEMYEKGEVEEYWHKASPKGDEEYLFLSYDGRTRTHGLIGYNMIKDDIEDQPPPDTDSDRTKLEDAKQRMYFIKGQMDDVFRYAPEIMDQPGETLMDIVGKFGRINPAAWINPYTGMPMKEVQCSVGFIEEINKVKHPDKEEYAGNYSYVKSLDSGGIIGVLELYYINEDGRLNSYGCTMITGRKSRH